MLRGWIRAVFAAAMLISVSAVLADTPPADKPSRWPLHAQTSDGSDVTIFQPQLDDFQGDTLTAHAAVAVSAQGATQPVYGAIWLQSRVSTDRVARTVHILDCRLFSRAFLTRIPFRLPRWRRPCSR